MRRAIGGLSLLPNMSRSIAKVSWFRSLARYYKDPSASVLGKLVAFFALIYAIVPLDLIPDVPIVGWIDDLGVMGVSTWWLLRMVARYRTPDDESRLTPKPLSACP